MRTDRTRHAAPMILSYFLFLLLVLFGCSHQSNSEVKIGAIFSQTGPIAPYGNKALEGLNLALDEYKGSGLAVSIIVEDAKSTPNGAIAAFQKLASVDKVAVIIGPESSGLAMAISSLANNEKIVLFAPTISVDKYSSPNDFTFRNWPSARSIAQKMADVCYNKLNYRKIAVMYINNDMGASYSSAFKERFKEFGGETVSMDSYLASDSNFGTQLSRINSAKPDAIYLIGQVEMGQILKQLHELNVKLPVLSGIGIEDPKVKETAGALINGIIYTTPAYNPISENAAVQKYDTAFRAKYNKASEIFAASTYDAMKILAQVIAQGNTTSEQIKNALFKTKDFAGATGRISFDENGDVIKDISIKKIEDGEYIFLSEDLTPLKK